MNIMSTCVEYVEYTIEIKITCGSIPLPPDVLVGYFMYLSLWGFVWFLYWLICLKFLWCFVCLVFFLGLFVCLFLYWFVCLKFGLFVCKFVRWSSETGRLSFWLLIWSKRSQKDFSINPLRPFRHNFNRDKNDSFPNVRSRMSDFVGHITMITIFVNW